MLDNWQRIEQIIKWSGAPSVNAFAREIGLSRGENLYQIKRGNNGISKDLAEIVTTKYPAISKAWLLTGEGNMLPSKAEQMRYDIPFYKIDAVDLINILSEAKPATQMRPMRPGEESTEIPEPEYYISFPLMRGCDFAAFSLSEAMQPEIPCGATLFMSRTEPSCITPGSTYLVKSKTFIGIRTLRRDPGSDKIRLVAKNSDAFDEVVINIDEIENLFHVKGVANIK